MHPYESYLRQTGRTTNMIKSIDPTYENIFVVMLKQYCEADAAQLLWRHPNTAISLGYKKVKFIGWRQFDAAVRGMNPATTQFYFDHLVMDDVIDPVFWVAFAAWNSMKRIAYKY